MSALRDQVLRYVKKHALLAPGERVAVACSGGADSVALFRLLLELRDPLGLVLSVAHLNHQLRGAESDADQQFVEKLASSHQVECRMSECDVAARSRERRESLETAARNVRYDYFDSLIASGTIDKVALAHTMNDQAETVLMRLLRGAGGLGLSAMASWREWPANAAKTEEIREMFSRQEPGIFRTGLQRKGYLRPLLETSREQIEDYLALIKQPWREDQSNLTTAHLRNRVRHELLPLLRRNYNPKVIESLCHTAELARAEEEYWSRELSRIFPTLLLPGEPTRGGGRRTSASKVSSSSDVPDTQSAGKDSTVAVNTDSLSRLSLALQRRVVRAIAGRLGETLDFEHTAEVLDRLLSGSAGSQVQINDHLGARRTFREIVFTRENPALAPVSNYGYDLAVPGEIVIPELKSRFTAKLVAVGPHATGYNRPNNGSLPVSVRVRNWRPGDRARLAHSKRAKKVKEILQEMHLSGTARRLWPVIESAEEIVWIRNCELDPLTDGLQEIKFQESEDAP